MPFRLARVERPMAGALPRLIAALAASSPRTAGLGEVSCRTMLESCATTVPCTRDPTARRFPGNAGRSLGVARQFLPRSQWGAREFLTTAGEPILERR